MKNKLFVTLLTLMLLSTPVHAARKPNPVGHANRAYNAIGYTMRGRWGVHNFTIWHINRAIGKSRSCSGANSYYTNAMHNYNFKDYSRSRKQLIMGNRAWRACNR